ncbi:MAG: ECF transporter S component [Deltaproteobacteria bacterium RBG_19FT_COMBO_43_11]|nr:MAG: ECF transporter S component [Deltaproteobacteria bacterium RBG_19FT_COMBO_43_11]
MAGTFLGTTEFRHHSLPVTQLRFYMFISFFVAGNIILPLIVHTLPQGGKIFLLIYFFTLIAAYRFGLTMGIATALLSPLANFFLTGMPPASALPVIMVKSLLLAAAASWIAHRTQKISLAHIAAVVVIYQFLGGIFEWIYKGSLFYALSDFQIGFPGILIQIVAGYFLLMWLSRHIDKT